MKEKHTWLIQRLQQPHQSPDAPLSKVADMLAFGGGGSGLTKEAREMLSRVFSFDYMGAAEFEFGALPNSLQPFAKDADQLIAFTVGLKPKEIADHHKRRVRRGETSALPPKQPATIYVLCRADDREYVTGVIRRCAMEKQDLKESSHLSRALDRFDEWDRRTCGWYELDNGFFFFTDMEMWRGTCALFGVETKKQAA